MTMKIDRAVVARNWREAKIAFDDAIIERKDNIKSTAQPLCIIWKDGTRTHYITHSIYDRWKLGRTYKFEGSEEIYHSGIEVR